MPKVSTQKAAKDYPDQGIKKGEMYYSWSFRYGGSYKSKTYPRLSQLTQSKLSGAYSAQEAMEDAIGAATCISDITDAIDQCVSDINDVAQEYRDSKDNMPEGLQEGPTGQECEEKADALEEYASELESARDEIDGLEACEYLDEDARKQAIRDEVEGDEPLTDDAVDKKYDELNNSVGFDDLEPEEAEAMLDAARELVTDVSLDI